VRELSPYLLQGEVKDTHQREIPRQYNAQVDTLYGNTADSYLKEDATTGQHYVDLNAAMTTYRGAWLYGQEHIITHLGRLRAEWEQFCPVPADLGDGILLRGNVLYRHQDGSWSRSDDQYEGSLRTLHGLHGGRFFVGRTQHTFLGRQLPNGRLKVVADLDIPLTHKSPSNPLVAVGSPSPAPGGGGESPSSYQRQAFTPPTLSYPSYESSYDGGF